MKQHGAAPRVSSPAPPIQASKACRWLPPAPFTISLMLIAILTFSGIIPSYAIAGSEDQLYEMEMLTAEEEAIIGNMLSGAVERRNSHPRLAGDFLFVTFPDGEEHSFFIRDLLMVCTYLSEEEWGEAIESYIGALFEDFEESMIFIGNLHSLDDAIPYLGLYLCPVDHLEQTPDEDPIYRIDIEGTATCIVWDFPDIRTTVEWSEIEGWDCTVDELFSIALENTLKNYPIEFYVESAYPGLDFLISEDVGSLVSTHILALDRLPKAIGSYGSLVTVPSQDVLVIHAIEDEHMVAALMAMMVVAHETVEASWYPLSAHVYWYNGHDIVSIPYVMGQEFPELDIYNMPPEFLMLLLTLLN